MFNTSNIKRYFLKTFKHATKRGCSFVCARTMFACQSVSLLFRSTEQTERTRAGTSESEPAQCLWCSVLATDPLWRRAGWVNFAVDDVGHQLLYRLHRSDIPIGCGRPSLRPCLAPTFFHKFLSHQKKFLLFYNIK